MHIDTVDLSRGVWRAWTFEPTVVAGMLCIAAVYAWGTRAAWRQAGPGRSIQSREVLLFVAGMTVVAIALISPLDAMSEQLFAAHMTQHVLLATVAPPLLVAGAPALAFTWAIPRARRRAVVRWVRDRRWLLAFWSASVAPAVAWAIHAVAVWSWHAPRLYEWALSSSGAHALEHACFLGTGILIWWRILHPRQSKRTGYAVGILVLFVTAMQTGLLGALLTLSNRAWYGTQSAAAANWGLTALEDQQLAGLTMWVVGGILYVVAMSVLFLGWLGVNARVIRPRVAALAVGAGVASGCVGVDRHVASGDVALGREAIANYGCGSCHRVPGVVGAFGTVGPSLAAMRSRSVIAGTLPNTPANLARWIMNAPAVDSTTAMPNLHVDPITATHIAAYLGTLR